MRIVYLLTSAINLMFSALISMFAGLGHFGMACLVITVGKSGLLRITDLGVFWHWFKTT